jgi:hypothetical protein
VEQPVSHMFGMSADLKDKANLEEIAKLDKIGNHLVFVWHNLDNYP